MAHSLMMLTQSAANISTFDPIRADGWKARPEQLMWTNEHDKWSNVSSVPLAQLIKTCLLRPWGGLIKPVQLSLALRSVQRLIWPKHSLELPGGEIVYGKFYVAAHQIAKTSKRILNNVLLMFFKGTAGAIPWTPAALKKLNVVMYTVRWQTVSTQAQTGVGSGDKTALLQQMRSAKSLRAVSSSSSCPPLKRVAPFLMATSAEATINRGVTPELDEIRLLLRFLVQKTVHPPN